MAPWRGEGGETLFNDSRSPQSGLPHADTLRDGNSQKPATVHGEAAGVTPCAENHPNSLHEPVDHPGRNSPRHHATSQSPHPRGPLTTRVQRNRSLFNGLLGAFPGGGTLRGASCRFAIRPQAGRPPDGHDLSFALPGKPAVAQPNLAGSIRGSRFGAVSMDRGWVLDGVAAGQSRRNSGSWIGYDTFVECAIAGPW